MRAALAAGAAIINDVRALQQPGAAEAVAEHDCGVVLMHMQGAPATMQQAPYYRDVTKDVVQFLAQRVQYAQARGIDIRRIAIDPGFGFGKTDAHNFTLLVAAIRARTYAGSDRSGAVAQVDAWARVGPRRGRPSLRLRWRRRCWPPSAARTSCACTTLQRRAMH